MESDYKDIIRSLLRNGNKTTRTKLLKKLDSNDDLLKEIYKDVNHFNRDAIILNNKNLTDENVKEILEANMNAKEINYSSVNSSLRLMYDFEFFEKDIKFVLKIVNNTLSKIEKDEIVINYFIDNEYILSDIIEKIIETDYLRDNIESISNEYPSFYKEIIQNEYTIKVSKIFIDALNEDEVEGEDYWHYKLLYRVDKDILEKNINNSNIYKLINVIDTCGSYRLGKISDKVLILSKYHDVDKYLIKSAKEYLIKENFK
ncbi:hypothetical protein [Staphylococcus phage vB_StaM_PB50]|nr:hypothetical protein [Staphylococcus phage vB_StaM_PB50]